MVALVSIHARFISRAIHDAILGQILATQVSIHARFISRAIPQANTAATTSSSFNPRPVYKPGDTVRAGVWVHVHHGFNPRPVYKPGDTVSVPPVPDRADVSIHARFISRAILCSWLADVANDEFQSTPGL